MAQPQNTCRQTLARRAAKRGFLFCSSFLPILRSNRIALLWRARWFDFAAMQFAAALQFLISPPQDKADCITAPTLKTLSECAKQLRFCPGKGDSKIAIV